MSEREHYGLTHYARLNRSAVPELVRNSIVDRTHQCFLTCGFLSITISRYRVVIAHPSWQLMSKFPVLNTSIKSSSLSVRAAANNRSSRPDITLTIANTKILQTTHCQRHPLFPPWKRIDGGRDARL